MKRDPAEILREALDLPPEARAAIAGSLINSLDDQVDEDSEAAWVTEITERLKGIESGSVKLIPWSEARRKLAGQ